MHSLPLPIHQFLKYLIPTLRSSRLPARCLTESPELACEEVVEYLTTRCLNLALVGREGAMRQVAGQVIVLMKILRLARAVGVDPDKCINAIMQRWRSADGSTDFFLKHFSCLFPFRLKTAKLKDDRKLKAPSSSRTGCSPTTTSSSDQTSPLVYAATKFAEGVEMDTEEFAGRIKKR